MCIAREVFNEVHRGISLILFHSLSFSHILFHPLSSSLVLSRLSRPLIPSLSPCHAPSVLSATTQLITTQLFSLSPPTLLTHSSHPLSPPTLLTHSLHHSFHPLTLSQVNLELVTRLEQLGTPARPITAGLFEAVPKNLEEYDLTI